MIGIWNETESEILICAEMVSENVSENVNGNENETGSETWMLNAVESVTSNGSVTCDGFSGGNESEILSVNGCVDGPLIGF